MKNIKKYIFSLSLISTFFSTNLFAYSQEDRIKDMQMMEQGLQQMQKGFLYNNLQDIQQGAELLKKHTAKIEPPVDKKTNAFKKSYAYDLTKREAKKIIKLAEDAVVKYQEHRTKQAMNSFAKILKQCMTCHTRIRKW
jgi:hypothetical protein